MPNTANTVTVVGIVLVAVEFLIGAGELEHLLPATVYGVVNLFLGLVAVVATVMVRGALVPPPGSRRDLGGRSEHPGEDERGNPSL